MNRQARRSVARQRRNGRGGREKTACGLIRVSDPCQIDTHSLAAQEAEIRKWCDRNGYELVAIYVDAGVSAYKDGIDHGPGLRDLLRDATFGKFEIAVVHTIDWLARNVRVLREVLRHLGEADVDFVSVTEGFDYTTPAGRMVLTNIATASEFVSGMIGVHVQKAQRRRVEIGLPVAPVPFGYDVDQPGGVPAEHATEGPAVLESFERRDRGEPYSQIAEWLNDRGFRTKKATPSRNTRSRTWSAVAST